MILIWEICCRQDSDAPQRHATKRLPHTTVHSSVKDLKQEMQRCFGVVIMASQISYGVILPFLKYVHSDVFTTSCLYATVPGANLIKVVATALKSPFLWLLFFSFDARD
mmetsp:Transcript_23960/g.36922  ORF Transcript_23960/g.36922 Transcript_23960/m.36922 type:complete len:109 (+) Transcript_23960:311-637(+)